MSTLCSFQLILPGFQSIREAIRTLFFLCVCVSGFSVAILVCKCIYPLCVRNFLGIPTQVDFIFSSFGVYDVLVLSVVMMCTLLLSMVTGVILQHRGHRRQFVCPTQRRGGLRFGTAK